MTGRFSIRSRPVDKESSRDWCSVFFLGLALILALLALVLAVIALFQIRLLEAQIRVSYHVVVLLLLILLYYIDV